MHLPEHTAPVRTQLLAAAALGDERAQQVAAALAEAVGPAVQLAVMSALSAAADEITAALLDVPGAPAVSISLDREDVRIDVHRSAVSGDVPDNPPSDDGEATARISLRLSEALKAEIDAAARREGVSVNTWLVRLATRATSRGTGTGWSADMAADITRDALRRAGSAHRVTGWINS